MSTLALSTFLILSLILNIILGNALIQNNKGVADREKAVTSLIKDGDKLFEEFEKFVAKHGKNFKRGAK